MEAMGAGHGPSRHELCPWDNENSLPCKMIFKNLLTGADSITDTTVVWTKNTHFFFLKEKIIPNATKKV